MLGVPMVCDEQWQKGLVKAYGVAIARALKADGGIDFVKVIRGRAATDESLSRLIPNMGTPSAPHLDFAGEIRSDVRMPTFHAARMQDAPTACYAIESGKLDMAACVHNAVTGREDSLPHDIAPAATRKKVVVVGAGSGGLEAARVAAERGHQVVVFEAAARSC